MDKKNEDELNTRKKLLWDLSQERRNHARHSETLRSSVSSYVLVAASGLVAVITFDDTINRYDFPLSLLLIAIGILGTLFSAAYTERYHRNRRRASELLKELDAISSVSNKQTLTEIEAKADAIHYQRRRFSLARGLASTHWLWLAFPILVSLVGLVLTFIAVQNWDKLPAKPHLPPDPPKTVGQ
jgi:hypothetical protein